MHQPTPPWMLTKSSISLDSLSSSIIRNQIWFLHLQTPLFLASSPLNCAGIVVWPSQDQDRDLALYLKSEPWLTCTSSTS
ncbi:hypothetical protein HanIR_Chr08g0368801 [Helianthus annuus]|nr:hypothetical protein HanIR_Chr08g0368801 [Helianthus annuus]